MDLKVAIVGLSPASHDAAPWGDPDWQKWGLPWDGHWTKFDRLFEIHDPRWIVANAGKYPADYIERLNDCGRLYMQGKHPAFPDAMAYPLDSVVATVGDYFQSSIAYMLALAIHEKATEIALFGVDMGDDTEYVHQRANGEYLIGLARGRGIKVRIHETSPLCRYKEDMSIDSYPKRYGWEK